MKTVTADAVWDAMRAIDPVTPREVAELTLRGALEMWQSDTRRVSRTCPLEYAIGYAEMAMIAMMRIAPV